MHSASFGFSVVIGNWVVTLLERAGGYSAAVAGVAGALTLLLGIVTRPLGGRVIGRTGIIAASFVAGGAGAALLAVVQPLGLVILAAAVVGLAGGIPFAPAFSGAARVGPDAPAAAVGLVNMGRPYDPRGDTARRPLLLAAGRRPARLRGRGRPVGPRRIQRPRPRSPSGGRATLTAAVSFRAATLRRTAQGAPSLILDTVDWARGDRRALGHRRPERGRQDDAVTARLGPAAPSSGTVTVLGEQLGRTSMPELRRRIGLVEPAFGRRFYPEQRALDVVLSGISGSILLPDALSAGDGRGARPARRRRRRAARGADVHELLRGGAGPHPARAGADRLRPAARALAWLLAQGSRYLSAPGDQDRRAHRGEPRALDVDLTREDLAWLDEIMPPGAAAGPRARDMDRVNL